MLKLAESVYHFQAQVMTLVHYASAQSLCQGTIDTKNDLTGIQRL